MPSSIILFVALITVLVFIPAFSIRAQEAGGPIYIIQEGDSLWDIALRFRVSVEDLTLVNGITNPNQLAVGTELIIPGLEGIDGILTTKPVNFGDTLRGLSRRYRLPLEILVQLNHIASPSELFVGTNLVLLEENANLNQSRRSMLPAGLSLLEIAILNGTDPWTLTFANNLTSFWSAVPGDVLHWMDSGTLSDLAIPAPSALPEFITSIRIQPLFLLQGKAAVIEVSGEPGIEINGTLTDHEIKFFEEKQGELIGIQGIHAMTIPGLYTMEMTGAFPHQDSEDPFKFTFSQAVLIRSANYPFDPVLTVSPETIDPAVTAPEDALWNALATNATPEKFWSEIFFSPAPEPFSDCWPSRFGNRRSYNGSAYIYFHSGLDFCGGVGINIHAPAPGIVVFAGPLTVRGNATMINHGWGVYTGYLHQSELMVEVDDRVETGQVIGLVGGTGRVTGPHLHWEVWAGGVQVDPLDWLTQIFP